MANAKHAQTLDRLNEVLEIHKNRAARLGQEISGKELANDIALFIETERLKKQGITEDPSDKASFSQFVVDFDGQVDNVLQAGWAEAEDEYGTDGELSPEFEQALERMVSSYCRQCNV